MVYSSFAQKAIMLI